MMNLLLVHSGEEWINRGEDAGMRSNGGLHPYRAGLFFILRERDRGWSGPRSNEKVSTSDVNGIARWFVVRMLAHQFGKTAREVAVDLIETHRALEDGQPFP